uniref:NADH dehydrogenase subunit 4L n=1 Tax=Signoretia aureola TaxID=2901393 RepID=A0A8K2ATZ3_9HEMI|nr:NADH dehydrogenase subunit 4L [Signoretia aureola]
MKLLKLMNLMFFLYMYSSVLISMIIIRSHIFMCLIILEFIVISLLYLILIFCLLNDCSFYLFVFMMTFYVCEGVLGLSLLVCMIRTHGNDYLICMF